jgi:GNAT superfamily N-acetyltransferase
VQPAGPVLSPTLLTAGVPGPGGVRIRLATAEDLPDVRRIVQMAGHGIEFEDDLAAAIEQGKLSSALLRMFSSEDQDNVMLDLARVAAGQAKIGDALAAFTLVLVADHSDIGVVAALLANPPGALLSQTVNSQKSFVEALAAMTRVIKLKAVAVVEEQRGNGIGIAMIGLCVRIYQQAGYLLLYGQFQRDTGLDAYYGKLGFNVHAPGQPLSIDFLSRPIGVTALQGERFFSMGFHP